jgi:thiamine-monophosphate kinase
MQQLHGAARNYKASADRTAMNEFDLIARIKQRQSLQKNHHDVELGIGDDAALVNIPAGYQLVVSTDMLNAGVHFPDDTAAADIGYKALAVNLSDIAAMGAQPRWATLALSLPHIDEVWIDNFFDGFFELANEHQVVLMGGDTTRGPLSINITIMGLVETGKALRRDRAQVGDDIWVSGTLGDAAGALQQWKSKGLQSAKLRYRLDRPTPRLVIAQAIAAHAHAAIDISDGLLADLAHITTLSNAGAEIDACRLPTSRTLNDHYSNDAERWRLQLSGGDDYELCFTASPSSAWEIEQALSALNASASVIGRVVAAPGIRVFDIHGELLDVDKSGYDHFNPPSSVAIN